MVFNKLMGDAARDGAAAIADTETERLDVQCDGNGDAEFTLAFVAGIVDDVVGDTVKQWSRYQTFIQPIRNFPNDVAMRLSLPKSFPPGRQGQFDRFILRLR